MSLIIKDLLRYYQEKDLGVVFENWDSKIKTLNKLIIDGELLGAIETIETFAVVNKEIQLGITCTLLKASLKELERKYSMNLIGLEQLNIEKSRISEKILNLAEQYNTSGETVKNIYNIII